MTDSLKNKSILLIISGGIAAYKSLELIRLIKKASGHVRCILTSGGAQFVTSLSISALSEEQVYEDLWSLKDETEMGHIRLSRESDLIVVAPASADIIAKIALGLANDLATTTLLAADKPILIAPAMNHKMWSHSATQMHIQTLRSRNVGLIGPDQGDMACGEYGFGRMAEPEDIFKAIIKNFKTSKKKQNLEKLKGLKILVTAGPTYEPIDPVRFIGNHSSGKQGYAIASVLAQAGADVTLVSGPTALNHPEQVRYIQVQTAQDMLTACLESLPCDVAICAAAVSDWSPESLQSQKIKKKKGQNEILLKLIQNPDILKTLGTHKKRPRLVIGFAAETQNLLNNAKEKLKAKNCDWILANDVKATPIFGDDDNHITWISRNKTEKWPRTSKIEIAQILAEKICVFFKNNR